MQFRRNGRADSSPEQLTNNARHLVVEVGENIFKGLRPWFPGSNRPSNLQKLLIDELWMVTVYAGLAARQKVAAGSFESACCQLKNMLARQRAVQFV